MTVSIIKPGSHPIVKHPHKDGSGQEKHGRRSGSKKLKAHDWNSLNRLRPERDGDIAIDLIAHTDSAQSVTKQEVKDRVVRSLAARLEGNEAVRKWAAISGPYDGNEGEFVADYQAKGRYGDDTLDWIDQQINAWASMQDTRIDEMNAAVGRVFGIPYVSDSFLSTNTGDILSDEMKANVNWDRLQLGRDAYDALAIAMYEETQASLEHAPDRMVFFRGLKGREYSADLDDGMDEWLLRLDDQWGLDSGREPYHRVGYFPGIVYTDALLKGKPVASWSASYSVAKDFAQNGVILAVSVPREAIFSTAKTGVGALFEDEVLLVDNGNNVVTAISARQTNHSADLTSLEAGQRGALDMPYGIVFPKASNGRKTKIAYSDAYISEFRKRGLWVDLMEDPTGSPDLVTQAIADYEAQT